MKKAVGLTLACALVLCGCTSVYGREPENTVVVQVLGVDWSDGVYTLTAAGRSGTGEPVIQRTAGPSLEEAFAALPGGGEAWLSLTGVSWLLLGDGVDPREVLLYVLADSGMSWRATVWYTPIAEATMRELEDGGMGRLRVLEESGLETVDVLDVLTALESGEAAEVPAVMAAGGTLEPVGSVWYQRSGGNG